jgi:hypothetical protein
VSLIGEVSIPRGAFDRMHQLDHLGGWNPVERLLHTSGEPQPHQADFFSWSVHDAGRP